MPYVAPTTVVTGTTIASAWGNSVKAGLDYLANPPACRVYHSTTQSLVDATETTLAFDSERWDTDVMHDTVTNNSRITFKTAGLYVISGHMELATGADYADLYLMIRVNGTGNGVALERDAGPGTFSGTRLLNVSTVYRFAVNDYVELRAYQDNTAAAARNVIANPNRSPEFSATWIGTG